MTRLSRRTLLGSALLLTPALLHARAGELGAAWAALEAERGGRLGVALLDTGTGQSVGHRADERFGLCSTFKLPLAAAALAGIDAGRWRAGTRLALGDLHGLGHTPVTRGRSHMTVLQLAQAAQEQSDNGAANALLRRLGGPAGFTQWLREQGDAHTRVERYEPEMNRVRPGEARDSSTPAAMAALTARLCLGESLSPASRARLVGWMEATRTGQRRLRAGLPASWRAGDKTGTGFSAGLPDRLNDVALFWPPGRAPLTLACYYEGPAQSSDWVRPEDEAVLAEVARLAVASLG